MKRIVFVLLCFIVIGCNENPVAKPENLLDEETMVDVLYDVSILQASKNYKPYIVDSSINVNTYVLEKYKIDSVTFLQNQKYYAADATNFKKMFEKVTEKIKAQEILADSLSKTEKNELKKPILKKTLNPGLD